jgi:hypothetical protein
MQIPAIIACLTAAVFAPLLTVGAFGRLDIPRIGAWFLTLLLMDPTCFLRRSPFGWNIAVVGTLILTAAIAILDITAALNRRIADNKSTEASSSAREPRAMAAT